MPKLTQKKLKEVLHYDPETGIFTWLKSTARRKKIDNVAGGLNSLGYLQIVINRNHYLGHRLIWLYHFGYFPENQIDHINRNPSDNRLKNLREVSQSCNLRNSGNSKRNTSGVKGISWYNKQNKWRARIYFNKQDKLLGYYNSFDNAVCARLAGEQCLDWSSCDSSSPALKYVKNNIQGGKYGLGDCSK